ncbi:helix-turn-helix domain-containing protein [Agromyces sp. NPDC056965]|uniref:helix-turn-helix domain-containing protein n=1 Tax=Agromyces sp. NPDC056965 TaxID=3345983 RepID=UPI00363EF3FB
MTPDAPLLYSPESAARLLGIARSTLYELLSSGALPSVKIGRSRRIRRDAIEMFVDRLSA